MSNYESKTTGFLFAIINAYRNDNLNLKEDIPKIEIPRKWRLYGRFTSINNMQSVCGIQLFQTIM